MTESLAIAASSTPVPVPVVSSSKKRCIESLENEDRQQEEDDYSMVEETEKDDYRQTYGEDDFGAFSDISITMANDKDVKFQVHRERLAKGCEFFKALLLNKDHENMRHVELPPEFPFESRHVKQALDAVYNKFDALLYAMFYSSGNIVQCFRDVGDEVRVPVDGLGEFSQILAFKAGGSCELSCGPVTTSYYCLDLQIRASPRVKLSCDIDLGQLYGVLLYFGCAELCEMLESIFMKSVKQFSPKALVELLNLSQRYKLLSIHASVLDRMIEREHWFKDMKLLNEINKQSLVEFTCNLL
jgi:hypothetical protein